MTKVLSVLGAVLGMAVGAATAADGLRVVTWNITYYAGDRAAEIGTVAYGEWNGHRMDPDVFCLQEMTSREAVSGFVAALNGAPGSPGDWSAAPVFLNQHSSLSTALVYRRSKLTLINSILVAPGSDQPGVSLRNVVRYDLQPLGYPEPASTLSIYPVHFKARVSDEITANRLDTAQKIVADIARLPVGRHVLVGADFNMQSSTESAYVAMNGATPNTGRLLDPISRPGVWRNSPLFRMIHTQDPRVANGGMDDRYDQVLVSSSLVDGRGMEYDGVFGQPWDLNTFADPAHSYRAWGNDGTTLNTGMRINGNSMVGPDIAAAIVAMAEPDGHIPVFLDLDLPGRLVLDTAAVELGDVPFGSERRFALGVSNGGDVGLWGAGGIAGLEYSLDLPAGVNGDEGPFVLEAVDGPVSQDLTLEAAAFPGGERVVYLRVLSDDPSRAIVSVPVHFTVVGCHGGDLAEPLGTLNFFDIAAFLELFAAGDSGADLAAPIGSLDFFDVSAFLGLFAGGCP